MEDTTLAITVLVTLLSARPYFSAITRILDGSLALQRQGHQGPPFIRLNYLDRQSPSISGMVLILGLANRGRRKMRLHAPDT